MNGGHEAPFSVMGLFYLFLERKTPLPACKTRKATQCRFSCSSFILFKQHPATIPKMWGTCTERIPSVGEIPLFVRYNYLIVEVVAVIIVGVFPTVRCIMITLSPPEP
jgi:hypothetical protein